MVSAAPSGPGTATSPGALAGLCRMVRLAADYPGRLGWFLVVGFLLGALGGAMVGASHTVLTILDTGRAPEWMTALFGPLKVRRAFFLLLGATAVLSLGKCVLSYLDRYLEAWLTQRVVMDTQDRLARHLLSLDLEFFHRERAGELLSRLTNDLQYLGRSIKFACVLLTTPLALLWYLAVVFYISWQLALVAFLAVPFGAWIIRSISRTMRAAAKRAQAKRADLTNAMVQFLLGMKVVKAFACEDFESRAFRAENRALFEVVMKRERARARERPTTEFVSAFGTLCVMALGGEWVFNGTLTPADLGAFLVALGLMYGPAKEISRTNNDLQEALPGAERVFQIQDLQARVQEGKAAFAGFEREIRFAGVDFAYEEGTPVLRNVDLAIRKGERIALVGPSGAGKSTLADLVLRFFDPQRGRVEFDGIDLRTLTFSSLREQIALVSQDPFLFNGNVRENIAYGRADADPAAVERAARAACVHDEILALPQGYETLVGERGANLSGGQRQRVAIARALFKDAPILILDEATSALDAENERAVQEALEHLMDGRTSLVIAHRLSTVRHADRIVMLEDGRITGIGKHTELLHGHPTYARFVALQTGELPAPGEAGAAEEA